MSERPIVEFIEVGTLLSDVNTLNRLSTLILRERYSMSSSVVKEEYSSNSRLALVIVNVYKRGCFRSRRYYTLI